VGEIVLEVGELHDPREPPRRSWRVRDPAYVDLVGLARSVRQQLQGLLFGSSEALPAQLPARGGAELEEVVQQRRGPGVCRDGGHDPLDVIDHRIAEAVALTDMVLTGDCVGDLGFHGPSLECQLHFDLLASEKLVTELTTLLASSPIAAIWLDEGLDGSALTAVWSASTDEVMALVWVGKSLLALLTSDVASLWIVLICDVRPLMPLLEVTLGRFLTALVRLVRSSR
jgi:hypothetical protein